MKSFVFSPALDAVSFYVPLLLSLSVLFYAPDLSWTNLFLVYFFAVWISDAGHVFATAIPLWSDEVKRKRWGKWLVIAPLAAVIFWLSLWNINSDLFKILFGYFAVYHIIMQQYGWMKILLNKAHLSIWRRRFELLIFWMCYLIPIIYWHTPLNDMSRSYIFNDNLLVSLPAEAWPFLNAFFMIVIAIYSIAHIVHFLRTGEFPIGRILFILYSLIWFYGGLVIFSNMTFFINVLLLTHGVAYHVHVHHNRRRGTASRESILWRRALPKWGLYGALILAISLGWYNIAPYANPDVTWPLYWIPLMAHHVWDSLLWRKSFFPT